jgi:hypothetical protein
MRICSAVFHDKSEKSKKQKKIDERNKKEIKSKAVQTGRGGS